MKKSIFILAALAALVGCGDDDVNMTPDSGNGGTTPTVNKSVAVGSQVGTMYAGSVRSVTYAVTTTDIAAAAYDVSVANLPAGVSVDGGKVTIASNGKGTLTLTSTDAVGQGNFTNLKLTLDGQVSEVFSLSIGAALPTGRTLSVGSASGTVQEGETSAVKSLVSYSVSSTNFTHTSAITITGSMITGLPEGISVYMGSFATNGSATMILKVASTAAVGVHKMKLTIDEVESNEFSLEVTAKPKAVNVAAQNGSLTAGQAGSASFAVTTTSIADSAAATFEWFSNADATVTVTPQAGLTASMGTLTSGTATVTVETTSAVTNAAVYYFKLKIDGTYSTATKVTVAAAASGLSEADLYGTWQDESGMMFHMVINATSIVFTIPMMGDDYTVSSISSWTEVAGENGYAAGFAATGQLTSFTNGSGYISISKVGGGIAAQGDSVVDTWYINDSKTKIYGSAMGKEYVLLKQ